ncbi:Uncharacterised protein [Klebsiella variicola]|nr:Uncharacterised protein [Klebsiella variicola]
MCYVKLKMCWREPAIVKPLLMKTQTLSLQVMSSYFLQVACCVALLAPVLKWCLSATARKRSKAQPKNG